MPMTLEEFFFNLPIYSPIEATSDFIKIITCYPSSLRIDFNGYNPWEKIESTFYVCNQPYESFLRYGGYHSIEVRCKRTDRIFLFFIHWNPKENKLVKVGQHPSVADFHISEIKHYKKLLSEEKLKEFTRAIGLAANGVGIGSFVYLRRIFEHLIEEAHIKCLQDGILSEDDYKKARMNEKIELLSSHLPSFLVENKSMYSILSKGIHELEEDICLQHFDSLRVGIEIILDEKLDELKKKEKIEAAKKKLSQLTV